MSLFSDMIDKGRALLSTPKAPTETEAVKRNSFDRADWEAVLNVAPAVGKMQATLEESVDYAADFMADLHAAVFKVEPSVRDAKEMAPTHVANRAVVSQLLAMPEMTTLRQHSTGDLYGSAMALLAIQDTAVEVLAKVHSAAEQAAKEEQQCQQQREERRKQIEEQMQDLQDNPPEEGDPRVEALQAGMDQFGQMPGPANDGVQQAARSAAEGAGQALRIKAREATEELDDEESLMFAFGVDPGTLQQMDVAQRMALAEKLRNNRLAQFAKLLGQFKAVQQAESRKRVVNAASEVHNITTGDDIARIATPELLNFADETLEDLMWARWSEQQLVINDVRGKENLGQGPIIAVVDESWSMSAQDVAGGTREAWSKALALALCDQAKRRKRDFIYIGFGSPTEQYVVEFLGGNTPIDKVIGMTEHFFAGGTHYEKPLLMALKIATERSEVRDQQRPDIVFITDDQYGSMDEEFMHAWNTAKDKTSLKCYGIAIGCSVGAALAAVSDNVREITALVSDPQAVGDLFRTI